MNAKEIRDLDLKKNELQLDAVIFLQEIAAQLAEANELRRNSIDAVGRTGPR